MQQGLLAKYFSPGLVEIGQFGRSKALATNVFPGCVGRGVRLGSESSSGGRAGGGVWKSGNLGTRKSRNLEIWGPGNPEIWGPKKTKINESLKVKIRSAKNVGKVWIIRKKSSWPCLGSSEAIFSIVQKNQKIIKFCLFSLVSQWALFTRCGPCCYPPEVGK